MTKFHAEVSDLNFTVDLQYCRFNMVWSPSLYVYTKSGVLIGYESFFFFLNEVDFHELHLLCKCSCEWFTNTFFERSLVNEARYCWYYCSTVRTKRDLNAAMRTEITQYHKATVVSWENHMESNSEKLLLLVLFTTLMILD